MKKVIIKSVDSDATLCFSDIERDHFIASLRSKEIMATKKIWGYTDCEFLVNLFSSMAENWKGWEDEISWGSIENDLEIYATSDHLGHIKLKVILRHDEGSEPWIVQSFMNLEANQMSDLAHNMRKFFE